MLKFIAVIAIVSTVASCVITVLRFGERLLPASRLIDRI